MTGCLCNPALGLNANPTPLESNLMKSVHRGEKHTETVSVLRVGREPLGSRASALGVLGRDLRVHGSHVSPLPPPHANDMAVEQEVNKELATRDMLM